jgi:hypothetical protein
MPGQAFREDEKFSFSLKTLPLHSRCPAPVPLRVPNRSLKEGEKATGFELFS